MEYLRLIPVFRDKSAITVLLVLAIIPLFGQTLENGCAEAGFGIDADTRAEISYFGNETAPTTTTDDWFAGTGTTGIGVLDTTGSWQFHNTILSGANVAWLQGMAYPQNAVINGHRLHDASYARDYYGGNNATDYTSFTKASKNGEDPADWDTGPHNVLGKNDLIDCYGHLRRDGISVSDHLWMYLGFSRIGDSGSSYFDAELYVEPMDYDPANNSFPSGGPDDGHTAWQFDAMGNIIKVGDLVTTCHFSTTNAPVLGLRIWVSRYDFLNTDPVTFTFGNEFDGDGNGAIYGYADIEIPPNSLYGCGVGNASFSPGPPWGTLNTSGEFSSFYEANQFVEVGLDLTVFGVDPVLLYSDDGASLCDLPFSNIIFKARASSSFTAQLKDFAGPFPFNYTTAVAAQIVGQDSISCQESIIELAAADTITGTYYSWYTEDGNIISNPNQFLISIDQPGTYILNASLAEGCEGGRDTIVVADNRIYPSAIDIFFEPNYDCNAATHLTAQPDGYNYEWTGPDGFESTEQETFVTTEGLYYLSVINASSGCSLLDSIYVLSEPCTDDTPSNIQTTVLLDTVAPSFSVPADILLDCNADPFDLNITGEATNESDNCDEEIGEAAFTDFISENYPCSGAALIERQWRLTDACGNVTIQTQLITIEDTTAPTFTIAADITLSCEEDISNLEITGTSTNAIDDCDTGTLQITYSDIVNSTSGCSSNVIITRTWLASDDCGNSITGVQTITIVDTEPPIFTVPQNISIECDQDPNDLSLVGAVLDEWDNCDENIGEATYTDVLDANNPCIGTAIITRTWSLTDDCGNETTATQIITLEDTTPPTLLLATENQPYVECDTLVPVPELGIELFVSDNCDNNVDVSFYEQILPSECPDKFIIQRIWVATDACNNKDSIVQEYQVQDTENPIVIVLPDDLTLACDEAIPDGNPLVDDNCSDEVNITFTEQLIPGDCAYGYTLERKWTWVDNCNNSETHLQYITVEDNIPPDFTVPEAITIACNQDPNDLSITGDATNEQDNCTLNIEANYTDNVTNGFPCEGATLIIRTWSLVDDCGNETTKIQEIQMEDTQPPVFTVPEDISISCELDPTNLTLTGDVLDEFDHCSATLGEATYQDSLSLESNCDGYALIYRFWTLVDDCGNETIAIQIVTLEDTTPPLMETPADLTINCSDDPYDLTLTGQITNLMDNCASGVLNNSYSDSIVVSELCEHNRTIFRIWSIEDACGNDSTYVQEISIQDVTPPLFTIPEDVVLECGEDASDLFLTGQVNTATDNCDANLTNITYTDQITNADICTGGITIDRLWTVADACGNTSSQIQQITIIDTLPPIFTAPEDISIDCDLDYNDLSLTGEVTNGTDACDQNIGAASYTDVITTTGVCTGSSIITRTWSMTDVCGNITTSIQIISLEDNTAPIFTVPQDITLECNEDPNDLSLTGDVIDEFDSCTPNIGEAVYSDSIQVDSSNCLQSILILRSWVLVDGCGNGTTAVQQIQIQDATPPVLLNVPSDTTVNCDGIPEASELVTVLDNCSMGLSYSFNDTITSAACADTKYLFRTWVVSDPCGNETTASQLITLINCSSNTVESTKDTTICEGTEVMWNENNYNTGGIYLDTLTTINGCDSIVQLTIIELEPIETEVLASICIGSEYAFGAEVYSQSGTYTQVLNAVEGCDSIVTLYLSVKENYEIDTNVYLCSGEELFIGGHSVTNPGIYSDTLPSDNDCDSLIHYHVEVMLPSLDERTVVLCEGEGFFVGGTMQTLSGVYVDTLIASNGCDSISVTTLEFHEQLVAYYEVEICANDSFFINGSFISEPGLYADTSSSMSNCDSITITELIVLNHIVTEQSYSICTGEGVWLNGAFETEPGIYFDTISAVAGCDSIVVTTLMNIGEALSSESLFLCEGEGVWIADNYYTEPGIYSDTISGNGVCDSIILYQLNIIAASIQTIDYAICQGGYVYIGGANQVEAGVYYDTLQMATGCDSIVISTLNIIPPNETYIDESICQGGGILFGGDYLQDEGTYSEMIMTEEGCDSLVYLNLTIVQSLLDTVYQVICQGDSILIGSDFETEEGWYNAFYVNNDNCDSTVIVRLEVVSSFESQIEEGICEGDSIFFEGNYYTSSGTFPISLSSESGCDSIVTLLLEVWPVYEEIIDATICAGEAFIFQNNNYSSSGTYLLEAISEYGCDSNTILNVMMMPTIEEEQKYEICQGDSIFLDGAFRFNSGIFIENLQAISGCDSTVIHDLSISPVFVNEEIITLCTGDGIWINGAYETNNGIYTQVLSTVNGCDSLQIINLIFMEELFSFSEVTLCEGEGYEVGGIYQVDEGVFYDTLMTVSGCDSIVGVSLQIVNDYVTIEEYHICHNEELEVNGTIVETTGIYIDSLQTVEGCDSLVFTLVEVLPVYEFIEVMEICEGDSLIVGTNVYSDAGIYYDSLVTVAGCDSVYIVTLTVIPDESFIEEVAICEGSSYSFNGIEYGEAGTYIHSWTGGNLACEYTATLLLTVFELEADTIIANVCEGDFYPFGNEQLTEPGEYTNFFTSFNGCDSMVVLFLSVEDTQFYSQQINLCEGDSLFVGGAYQYVSGSYMDTYSLGASCDSIVETTVVFSEHKEYSESFVICEGDSLFLFDAYFSIDTLLTVSYNGYNGCDSIVEKTLEVIPVADLLVEDYEICIGESVQLSVFSNSEIAWLPEEGLSCLDCPMPNVSPEVTTTYTVVTESCLGEELSATVVVTVHSPPNLTITAEEDEGVALGDSVVFSAFSNDPFATISWSDSDGNVICENCNTATVIPFYGVSYVATAINNEGCMVQDEVQFNIRNSCLEGVLEIPNFITPNGDGHNDNFEIRYSDFAELSVLRIYNRWGELVFQTSSVASDFWNGTFRGKSLNPDVYIYYVKGKCLNGNEFIEKGNVTILK